MPILHSSLMLFYILPSISGFFPFYNSRSMLFPLYRPTDFSSFKLYIWTLYSLHFQKKPCLQIYVLHIPPPLDIYQLLIREIRFGITIQPFICVFIRHTSDYKDIGLVMTKIIKTCTKPLQRGHRKLHFYQWWASIINGPLLMVNGSIFC